MEAINGKVYPMWSQFVEKKNEFIGGVLQDFGDSVDRNILGHEVSMTTTIDDIILRGNGIESAWFEVAGENFSCGFDTRHGGVIAGEEGWLTFSGYGGHKWRIKKP